jgi:3-deoxy-D-manno-octulosonic-acid transferase
MRSPSVRIHTGLLHNCYSVGVNLLLPLVCVGLVCSRRGRRRFGERFGSWGAIPAVDWWLHGASVGEVQGLVPLMERLKQEQRAILLTATSPTGLERGSALANATRLVPIDSPVLVGRAFGKVSFERFVVTETELWPNLLRRALESGKPCHIINGRISNYTARRYGRVAALVGPLLARFRSISVPDEQQRARFVQLGVDPSRIHVTGHTKYDTRPRFVGEEARREARQAFFPGIAQSTPILTLGSIRNGEEEFWFGAIERIWREGHALNVIVAPRHAERFEYFWNATATLSGERARWSKGVRTAHQVLLLDAMGVLERAYAASDCAFVGATMVNIGGHNPFEPAMYGVPIAVGEYTSVIAEPVSQLLSHDAISRLRNQDEVYQLLKKLCTEPDSLRAAGARARQVWASHQGAVERVLRVIKESEALV